MSDDRRMTTDRFYGGVSNRLANLRAMLEFIHAERPARERVVQWVTENTLAGSRDAVAHHLAFLASIEIVEFEDSIASPGRYGDAWLADQEPETLYRALNQGVKGFQTILESLCDGPMTDEEIMDLLVSEFDEAEMSTPGPAVRHREWLQVLGLVERADSMNQITADGRELVDATDRPASAPVGRVGMRDEVSVGDRLSKETIEDVFDTGFGYQIAGINPRRDEQDRRYVLVFANEDGPYNDSVTSGEFEYIGEGQTGDQSTSSPGNSTLIEAADSEFPVHFFYKNSGGADWEYQGLVDVREWTFDERNGRDVIVFTLRHTSNSEAGQVSSADEGVSVERTHLKEALNQPPQLTEENEAYTETRRRARDAAFRTLVREAYDNTCAVCGAQRETPNGHPEVEAAHIYPKRRGGADDVRNGLALCKLHHWAFDAGWLAIDEEFEIVVAEVPERHGYHEFKQLEGRRITLPTNVAAKPAKKYLKAHRKAVFQQ